MTVDGRVRRIARKPLEHFTARSLVGLLSVVLAGVLFGVLLMLVRFHVGPLYSVDRGVADGVNHYVSQHKGLVAVLQGIASLGGRPIMIWLVVAAVVAMFIRRQPRLAVFLIIAGLGALILDPSLKALVGRLRPVVDVPVAHAPGNSFPSGHALGSFIVYGALLLVFLPTIKPRLRPYVIGLVATLVVLIGMTRIALGVHFVSDVIAGWLLGAAWLGVTLYAFRLWRREEGRPTRELTEGLEPEAAHEISPAPDEKAALPHPWAAAAELLVGWVIVLGALYVFGILVSYHVGGTFIASIDRAVPTWFAAHRTPTLNDLSWWASKAGDTHAILAVSLMVCPLFLAAWRRWRPVVFIVLTLVGEVTLFLVSQTLVDRPRPPVGQLDQVPTGSFPSGHIAATICLYTAIALLVMPRVSAWWRWVTVVLAVVMPLIVTVSRFYRGMHHPTDVVGAIILTSLWLGLLWYVVRPNGDLHDPTDTIPEPVPEAELPSHGAADDLQHQDRRVRQG
jgi:membrane-associated phospholipid phosphatase